MPMIYFVYRCRRKTKNVKAMPITAWLQVSFLKTNMTEDGKMNCQD